MLKVRCKEGYQKNTKLYFLSIKVCPILPTTKVVGMTDSLIKIQPMNSTRYNQHTNILNNFNLERRLSANGL